MMHFSFFAVVDAFHHFRTDEGATSYDAVYGDHFAEVLRAEGAGVYVVVAEGTFEADVEDCVVCDIGVLRRSEGHGRFFQCAIEGREEVCWFV